MKGERVSSIANVLREERFFCNHFFRLLCERFSDAPEEGGLAATLQQIAMTASTTDLSSAEILTEVAAFRDCYFAHTDKPAFMEQLYDAFLPRLKAQYAGLITTPTRPSDIFAKIGSVHPAKFKDIVDEPEFERGDVLFYRELGALFNAKPDFLLLLPDDAIWIEAKVWSSFSSSQLVRMEHIAQLCSSPFLREYFGSRRAVIVLLGSARRHQHAQKEFAQHKFISWEWAAECAEGLFPAGKSDISAKALARAAV